MEIGLKCKVEITVDDTNTAKTVGSGDLDVFSTPMMIALMEKSALECVKPYLENGQGTVGTLVNIKHVSATPMGMKVYSEAELTEIDAKRLVFEVKAYDEKGLIGEGTHERFIIDNEKFMARVNSKK